MSWFAIGWAGFVATVLTIALLWFFRAVGATQMSATVQVGCLFLRDPRHPATETIGFTLLLVLGSTVVPALYLQLFELFGGASWVAGLGVGAVHGLITAALLTFLGTISACIRAGAIPAPGPMGTKWGWLTPFAVVAGHGLYGSICGAILANV